MSPTDIDDDHETTNTRIILRFREVLWAYPWGMEDWLWRMERLNYLFRDTRAHVVRITAHGEAKWVHGFD